jgi:hypothetical protein
VSYGERKVSNTLPSPRRCAGPYRGDLRGYPLIALCALCVFPESLCSLCPLWLVLRGSLWARWWSPLTWWPTVVGPMPAPSELPHHLANSAVKLGQKEHQCGLLPWFKD